jgi:hypothetical protein
VLPWTFRSGIHFDAVSWFQRTHTNSLRRQPALCALGRKTFHQEPLWAKIGLRQVLDRRWRLRAGYLAEKSISREIPIRWLSHIGGALSITAFILYQGLGFFECQYVPRASPVRVNAASQFQWLSVFFAHSNGCSKSKTFSRIIFVSRARLTAAHHIRWRLPQQKLTG